MNSSKLYETADELSTTTAVPWLTELYSAEGAKEDDEISEPE
jgi:hypothetical protein